MLSSPNTIVALDFDGVLCDSAVETAITAWRAGRALWPEWSAAEPPADCIERFCGLRPLLETGYEAIPFMRLAWLNNTAPQLAPKKVRQRVGEIITGTGLAIAALVELFGNARDEWIAHDFPDWLSRHRFYPDTVQRLAQTMETHTVYVITTKQERFADALLRAQGIDLPSDRLYGLEAGCPKSTILETITRCSEVDPRPVEFVEDRLDTLLTVATVPTLERVSLYFAAWGYTTTADRRQAADHPRIQLLQLESFLTPTN